MLNKMKNIYNKGISLLEIIIIIAVIGILSAIIIPSFASFKSEQALKNTTVDIISLLNKAKLDSNSYLGGSLYSVYFETDKAVYFKGTTYSESNPTNEVVLLNSSVNIPSTGGINLTDTISANTITFPRLTENVRGYGNIVIRMTNSSERQKVITINKLGAISLN
jgi:type II secretory pathway pseudopilin PulG